MLTVYPQSSCILLYTCYCSITKYNLLEEHVLHDVGNKRISTKIAKLAMMYVGYHETN